MNEQAIQVLKQIYERGLKVLWRFGAPYPKYGDGKQMPPDEWKIVYSVLGADAEKTIEIEGETLQYRVLQYRVWESDYLTIRSIDRDEYTEEHVGLLKEYRLTEKALALIAR